MPFWELPIPPLTGRQEITPIRSHIIRQTRWAAVKVPLAGARSSFLHSEGLRTDLGANPLRGAVLARQVRV